MTDPTPAAGELSERDVEALAEVLQGLAFDDPREDARAILASDWFAARTEAADRELAAARAELAVIQNLAMEHMSCTGCPTPWWLRQAFSSDGSA